MMYDGQLLHPWRIGGRWNGVLLLGQYHVHWLATVYWKWCIDFGNECHHLDLVFD